MNARLLRLSSFRAKLLAALLGAVAVVLVSVLATVQRETSRQLEAVTRRAAEQSRRAFEELEVLQRTELGQLARTFTDSRRTLAALEAALEAGDLGWLEDNIRYELELKRVSQSLAGFTDAFGEPVLTLVDGRRVPGDPAGLELLAERLLEAGDAETLAYLTIDDRLFTVQMALLELAGHAVGMVAFGLPMDDAAAGRLGQVVGAEICVIAAGRCVAGTPRAKQELGDVLVAAATGTDWRAVERQGERWAVFADPLSAARLDSPWRSLAVPLDPVLAPFERIRRALLAAGLGALILVIALSVLLARRLVRPIHELVGATGRIASGDYQTRVATASRDEFRVLAHAFNSMAEGLQLKERYRGVLDKVVSPEVAADLLEGEITLGGENRRVTTLFSDIRSFTPLVEGMEPQQVIGLLNECLGRLSTAIEAEGGIVDKYLGDGIMAIFGAPVGHADDPLRAVRAGLSMQDSMRQLNQERAARGEPPLQLAVGIHSGVVVAGNVGSANRLNYTVLGDAVNLSSRLCSAAGAGEILVSDETLALVREHVVATPLGTRELKGISRPVPVHAITAIHGAPPSPVPARAGRSLVAGLTVAALLGLAAPAATAAQQGEGGLPTLADLGIGYLSPSGVFQLDLSGRLDLEGYLPQDEPTWLILSTDPFLAGRMRLLADVFLGDRLYGLLEARVDRGTAPRVGDLELHGEQAFVRVRPSMRQDLHLQVGKFPTPFGGFARRHLTTADPLIRPPLAYEYRTLVTPDVAPGAPAGFLNWKTEAHERRPAGAPPVWGVPYPWGAMLLGRVGPLHWRVAGVNSAPSSAPEEWEFDVDRLRHPSWVAGLDVQLSPELRLGVSHSRGPYLQELRAGSLPAGSRLEDFQQQIWGGEATYARGRTTLRGEAFFNIWQVPNLPEDPTDLSYYLEGSLKLAAGLAVAMRYNEIRFNELARGGNGTREIWDFNTRRLQLGAGYRIRSNTELRAEYLISRTDSDPDPRDNLLSVQWWWAY